MKRMIKTSWVAALATMLLFIVAVAALGQDVVEELFREALPRRCIKLLDYYNSGWFNISPGDDINKVHRLGGDPGEYLIFLYGKSSSGIHQANYGTAEESSNWIGGYWWQLDEYSITIHRAAEDVSGPRAWEQAKVVILEVDLDNPVYAKKCLPIHSYYDSGWQSISGNQEIPLSHDLGGNPDRYLVFLYGRGEDGYGSIHHVNYGTAEQYKLLDYRWFGAEWYKLDEYSITIRRATDDDNSLYIPEEKQWDKFRVVIIRLL